MASTVVGKVVSVSLTFKWEIENFCLSCKDVGDELLSEYFTATSDSDDTRFFLQLYPKGISENYKDYLSLFLCVNNEIKATGSLKILNNEGQAIVDKILDENFLSEGGVGYNKFISRDFVVNPENGILHDDKITIACEIRYRNSEIKYNKVPKQKIKDLHVLPRLEDTYEILLNDSKFSDVSLISEGKAVKVHKCILASRSSVFAAMFGTEMKEKQDNAVEITDVRYDVLMEMIRFVYVAKVNNIDALANELAVAADKYALDGLKNMCEKTMIKNLNLENVIDYLQLADRIYMDKLKKKATELIVENACDVSDRPEFDLLSCDIMSTVFRCLANKSTN